MKKKSPKDRRGGLQGDRKRVKSSHIRKTSGVKSYTDRWLENLSHQVSKACDWFWLQTPERRHLEEQRKRRPYNL